MLEFCGGGDLGQFIQARGPSPEATARHFMLQLAAGLSFLRSRRLIHRDIKPQNLLLSDRSSRASLKVPMPTGPAAVISNDHVLDSPSYIFYVIMFKDVFFSSSTSAHLSRVFLPVQNLFFQLILQS